MEVPFAPTHRAQAAQLLVEQCGNNLPFEEHLDEYARERIRYVVLMLSGGSLAKLQSSSNDAKVEFRGVLMAAGFCLDVMAHYDWLPRQESPEKSLLLRGNPTGVRARLGAWRSDQHLNA